MSSTPQSRADVADFRARIDGVESEALQLTAFDGIEALSELFRFRIELVSEDDGIAAPEVLGRSAVLELDGEHGTRAIHGILRRFERIGQGGNLAHYSMRLVPPHWILTRRVQSRVFNEKRCKRMDVMGIVAKVCADAGLPASAPTTVGLREYETREIAVQYQESDWAFVSRLLEEEGIYFSFDHSDGECRMVLVDSKDAHAASDAEIPFRERRNLVAQQEFVHAARREANVRSGAMSLDDFDFKDPARELRLDQNGSVFTGLRKIEYPGGYVDPARGRRLVQTRHEAEQLPAEFFRFRATVRDLRCGARFRLKEHPSGEFNAEYLITRVRHRATQPQSGEGEVSGGSDSRYEAAIRAITAEKQFRPPRVTPCPRVAGSQTAIVVGPAGEEIHTDEFGRVEVRFHWDQEAAHDVGASCWIRVSQGWAGGQYGMMFLPRVGQEVIVDFLEGNPDAPIITGRVFNRDHMPPYKLPDRQTVSAIRTCTSPGAKGGNEIRFEDKKGGEQLLLFAQNSLHLRAQGSRYESVCGEAHQTVAGDAFELVKKNKDEWVKLDVRQQVDGSKWDWVQGNKFSVVKGTYDRYVKGLFRLHNADGIVVASDTSVTLWSYGNFIKLDKDGITIVGNKVKINSGGSADPGAMGDGVFPKEAVPAVTTEFGHNVRYTAPGESGGGEPDEVKQSVSWIEIELIDEAGRPVPNEVYEIILPDGKKIGGRLDQLGRAHVGVPDPGACQITFPRLDAAAWEPIG